MIKLWQTGGPIWRAADLWHARRRTFRTDRSTPALVRYRQQCHVLWTTSRQKPAGQMEVWRERTKSQMLNNAPWAGGRANVRPQVDCACGKRHVPLPALRERPGPAANPLFPHLPSPHSFPIRSFSGREKTMKFPDAGHCAGLSTPTPPGCWPDVAAPAWSSSRVTGRERWPRVVL